MNLCDTCKHCCNGICEIYLVKRKTTKCEDYKE